MIMAAAPSLTPDALPAVIVPGLRTKGFSFASPSSVVSARGCSSLSTTTGPDLPPGTSTGAISASKNFSAIALAARFHDLGFEVIATGGTAQAIARMGVPVTRINKLGEGSPNVVDLIRKRRCDLVINTPTGSGARSDGYEIRTAAVRHGIPCVTTMTGATAAARAIAAGLETEAEVRSLQEIHCTARRAPQPQ